SEGILWDFVSNSVSDAVLSQYEIDKNLVSEIVPTFGDQGELTTAAAAELGLKAGTKVTYRAGDQPNNAFSLNVLEPGQVASTAGTSGVVYGISDAIKYDPETRVNTFAHVNHSKEKNRFGILLCINGTGISYSWIRRLVGNSVSYPELNQLAGESPVGSKGLRFINFGNGAERMLGNKDSGASLERLNFNIHGRAETVRSVLEGVAFSFKYGIDIMEQLEMNAAEINAGHANMFLSPVFTKTLATLSGATINLYDTDGSVGAARAAAVGAGIYKSFKEAFTNLKKIMTVEPDKPNQDAYLSAYSDWQDLLNSKLKSKGSK
ncbi:MAG: FGGY-family carbohydrate kinase, partial [Bacteroidetes bacterium]|nr:FGGY-family carbohydrate kinase [Bacteroidota bacterium]